MSTRSAAGEHAGGSDPTPRRPRRRIGALLVAVAAVVVLTAGAALVTSRVAEADAMSHAAAAKQVSAAHRAAAAARTARGGTSSFQDPHASAAPKQTTASPTRVRIPSIHVDAHLQHLAVGKDGVLAPPTNFTDAGWFAKGVRPGNIGPAVIAGHFDAAVGPAVFDDLRLLRPGDVIDVSMSDGTTVRFTTTSESFVKKALFPSSSVYGPTPDAQLRLITCGGAWDDQTGHYIDNLVVFATRTA